MNHPGDLGHVNGIIDVEPLAHVDPVLCVRSGGGLRARFGFGFCLGFGSGAPHSASLPSGIIAKDRLEHFIGRRFRINTLGAGTIRRAQDISLFTDPLGQVEHSGVRLLEVAQAQATLGEFQQAHPHHLFKPSAQGHHIRLGNASQFLDLAW